jgi:hypothetical protein
MKRIILTAIAILALAGCGTSNVASKAKATAPPKPLTATQAATALQAKVPDVTKVVTITENNDPNNMIGRPNGYVSAAVMVDKTLPACDSTAFGVDCGATVEVWPTVADATTRGKYIHAVLSGGGPLGSEWDFVKGDTVLRVSGNLKPSQAGIYGSNFGGKQIQ